MQEEFRIITGFENYMVSNFGNIKTNQNSMNEFTSSVVYTVSNCISKCNI